MALSSEDGQSCFGEQVNATAGLDSLFDAGACREASVVDTASAVRTELPMQTLWEQIIAVDLQLQASDEEDTPKDCSPAVNAVPGATGTSKVPTCLSDSTAVVQEKVVTKPTADIDHAFRKLAVAYSELDAKSREVSQHKSDADRLRAELALLTKILNGSRSEAESLSLALNSARKRDVATSRRESRLRVKVAQQRRQMKLQEGGLLDYRHALLQSSHEARSSACTAQAAIRQAQEERQDRCTAVAAVFASLSQTSTLRQELEAADALIKRQQVYVTRVREAADEGAQLAREWSTYVHTDFTGRSVNGISPTAPALSMSDGDHGHHEELGELHALVARLRGRYNPVVDKVAVKTSLAIGGIAAAETGVPRFNCDSEVLRFPMCFSQPAAFPSILHCRITEWSRFRSESCARLTQHSAWLRALARETGRGHY